MFSMQYKKYSPARIFGQKRRRNLLFSKKVVYRRQFVCYPINDNGNIIEKKVMNKKQIAKNILQSIHLDFWFPHCLFQVTEVLHAYNLVRKPDDVVECLFCSHSFLFTLSKIYESSHNFRNS